MHEGRDGGAIFEGPNGNQGASNGEPDAREPVGYLDPEAFSDAAALERRRGDHSGSEGAAERFAVDPSVDDDFSTRPPGRVYFGEETDDWEFSYPINGDADEQAADAARRAIEDALPVAPDQDYGHVDESGTAYRSDADRLAFEGDAGEEYGR